METNIDKIIWTNYSANISTLLQFTERAEILLREYSKYGLNLNENGRFCFGGKMGFEVAFFSNS